MSEHYFRIYGRNKQTNRWNALTKVKYENADQAQVAIENLIDRIDPQYKKYNLYKTKRIKDKPRVVGTPIVEIIPDEYSDISNPSLVPKSRRQLVFRDDIILDYNEGCSIKHLQQRYALSHKEIHDLLVDNDIEIRIGPASRMDKL